MSRENLEFVRTSYEAMNELLSRGEVDRAAIERIWTSDCVVRPSGLLPESAEVHGHDGIEGFIRNQTEAFDPLQVETLEYLDAGDRVVVPIRFGGRARYTGMEVTFEVIHVVTVRGRQVARVDMYQDRAEALEAAGLGE